MARPWRRRVRPTRRATPESHALFAARGAARLRLDQTAKAIGVHPRTLKRWEVGETRPSPEEWSRLLTFFAPLAPDAAVKLAAATGVPLQSPSAPTVDVRAALRDLTTATENARGSLLDLARAAQDSEAVTEGDA
jgi:predicted transcriptional regulator